MSTLPVTLTGFYERKAMSAYIINVPSVHFKAPNRARDGGKAKPQPVRALVEVEVYDQEEEDKALAEAWNRVDADMLCMTGKTYREWWGE